MVSCWLVNESCWKLLWLILLMCSVLELMFDCFVRICVVSWLVFIFRLKKVMVVFIDLVGLMLLVRLCCSWLV